MCQYASFAVGKLPGKLRVYAGVSRDSHEGIEIGWNLKPGEYREAEWVDETPDKLYVRVEDGEFEETYKQAILRKYPTRSALLASIREGRGERRIVHYRNGKRHGVARGWYADGTPYYVEHWRDDKQHGVERHWYANGKPFYVTHWRDDKQHGVKREWHDNGKPAYVAHYRNGEKHGVERQWYANGIPHHERHWRNGKLHGVEREWYTDGKPHYERRWFPDGKPAYVNRYRDGKLIR